jgi:hypothetical protein
LPNLLEKMAVPNMAIHLIILPATIGLAFFNAVTGEHSHFYGG